MQLPPDELFEDPDNPVTMEVDYVRVYELTGRPYKTPEGAVVPVEPLPDNARTPDATGNLVYDVNFEKGIKDNQEGIDDEFGDYWNYVHNAQFGGEADVTVEEIDGNNYAKIDVKNKGSQPYSIQLEQLTTLELADGTGSLLMRKLTRSELLTPNLAEDLQEAGLHIQVPTQWILQMNSNILSLSSR